MASSVYMGTEPLVLRKKALGVVVLKITLQPCSTGLET